MVGAARPHPNRSRGDLGDPRGRGHAAASGLGRSRGVRRFARISRDRRGSRPPNVDRNPRRGSLENAGSNGDAYSRTSHGRRRSGHLQDHLQGQKLTSAAALLTTCGEWFTGLGLRLLHCQGPRALEQMCLHVQPAGSSVVATATTSPGRVVPSPSSKEKLNCHHHGRNRSDGLEAIEIAIHDERTRAGPIGASGGDLVVPYVAVGTPGQGIGAH